MTASPVRVALGLHEPYSCIVGELEALAKSPRGDGSPRHPTDTVVRAHTIVTEESRSVVPTSELPRYTKFAGAIASCVSDCHSMETRVAALEAEWRKVTLRCVRQYLELSLLALEYGLDIDDMVDERVYNINDVRDIHKGKARKAVARTLRPTLSNRAPLGKVDSALAAIAPLLTRVSAAGSTAVHGDPASDKVAWMNLFATAKAELGDDDARVLVKRFVDARKAAAAAGLASEHEWMSVDPTGL